MTEALPRTGLYEALLTRELERVVRALPETVAADEAPLAEAEAADRVARHVARALARAVEAAPEARAAVAVRLAGELVRHLDALTGGALGLDAEIPVEPARVLRALLDRSPDGAPRALERPLTPLLDTTVLTRSPGEPALTHELRAEVPSADAVDAVVAFIRWTGVRPLLDALRRHCAEGKPLRVLTTTYTRSTEPRALDALAQAGAELRVSYDESRTRLHAKAWLFHRGGGYSTAYVGSSNLSHSAQVTGLEWNVRLAEARNPDAVAKLAAVFASYWESREFVPYDPEEFARRMRTASAATTFVMSPVEIELRPFQERLLEEIAVARHRGRHRNLLVAATGTGKTVMAAVDYARLRRSLPRDRLLFVAHRAEILDQSMATFRHALRDASFGERWVGGERPRRFDHVFASIQSLDASGVERLEPHHFDVVVVDESTMPPRPPTSACSRGSSPASCSG